MKIRINGESFDFDGQKKPLSEALWLEKELHMRYADWEQELQAGSMRAMAGFIGLVWRRDGRDVNMASILDGTVEVDLMEVLESFLEAAKELEAEQETAADPKNSPAPDGTPGTGTVISPRSASLGSVPGRSGSSSRTTSKR